MHGGSRAPPPAPTKLCGFTWPRQDGHHADSSTRHVPRTPLESHRPLTMNITDTFVQARDLLWRAHGDPDRAVATFRWPTLEAFNWVTHWFDPFADGNRQPALRVVHDHGGET